MTCLSYQMLLRPCNASTPSFCTLQEKGGSWADRRWLGEAALAGRGCGSWAGLRWLGVAAMAGRGGAGEADVHSGEARWRCVGEARWTCGGGGASAGGCARVEVRPRVRRLLREGGVVRRRRTKKIGKKTQI
nr:hypothetical protein Itr_chr07CG10740 [Ipomoea trifida]